MPVNCDAEFDTWEKYRKAIDLFTSGKITRSQFVSFWHFLQKAAADFNRCVMECDKENVQF